jgi:oligoribonuclease NrnB/cAMP/cGMP phosphodiesterase (DHH superfamily)
MVSVLVTHTDWDGSGCAVLFRKIFSNKETEIFYCDYRNVDSIIEGILDRSDVEKLFITDICVKKEVADKILRSGIETILIDHHKTAQCIADYPFAYISDKMCGTKLFYNHIINNFAHYAILSGNLSHNDIIRYAQFAEYCNDHDLWLNKLPLTEKFDNLFHILGSKRFVDRFLSNPEMKLTKTENYILEIEDENKQKYIYEVMEEIINGIDGDGNNYGLAFAEQYPNDIAHEILQNYDLDYAIVVDLKRKTVSLRSRDFDVEQIAVKFGGGGHVTSSGFEIDDNSIIDLSNVITRNI